MCFFRVSSFVFDLTWSSFTEKKKKKCNFFTDLSQAPVLVNLIHSL